MSRSSVITLVILVISKTLLANQTSIAHFPPLMTDDDLRGSTGGFNVRGTVLGQFGQYVAGIGDVNADGVADLASGDGGVRWYEDCYCEATSGMVHVIFGGRSVGRDGLWTTDDLDGSTGFSVPDIIEDERIAVPSAAGDLNGDGIDDFLIGAPGASPGWWAAGKCYVIYGEFGLGQEGVFDLRTLDGSNGFVIRGTEPLQAIGANMAPIGDFNADGFDDILLCSPSMDIGGYLNVGQCYVIFGGTDFGASGSVLMSALDADTGIVINGPRPQQWTGRTCSSAGDFNGDGFPDIVIGSERQYPPNKEAYLVYGGPDAGPGGVIEILSLDGSNGFIIRPTLWGGSWIAGADDVNADGYDDILFSENYDPPYLGWADVIFGGLNVATNGVFDAITIDGTNGFKIVSAADHVTKPLGAGDMNNDGYPDIAMRRSSLRHSFVFGGPGVGASGSVSVDDLDGERGFTFRSSTGALQAWASAGDVNDDGVDDFLLGVQYGSDLFAMQDLGQVSVIYGTWHMGDADGDGDLDLADFYYWSLCMLGPGYGPYLPGCEVFDFDRDGHVDLRDFAGLQDVFGE